jgi:Transglycosylase SLT domain
MSHVTARARSVNAHDHAVIGNDGSVRSIVSAALILGFVITGCSGGATDDGAAPTSSATRSTNTEPQRGSTTPTTTVSAPSEFVPPRSERDAATRITEVERALRDPKSSPGRLPALGWEQQAMYRVLAANDTWADRVLASVPDDVEIVVAANLASNASIATLVDPPESLPAAWRIVAPPPPEALLGYYREAEAASNIPWSYLAAINLVETRMGRIAGDSTAGAQGPMQFIPSSWEAFGEGGDVRDPRDAILAAGRYLAAAGGPDDMRAAIFAYNHADAYVAAVTGYASVMAADERSYLGYYHWQVTYRTVDGLHLLPEGYPEVAAVRLDGL